MCSRKKYFYEPSKNGRSGVFALIASTPHAHVLLGEDVVVRRRVEAAVGHHVSHHVGKELGLGRAIQVHASHSVKVVSSAQHAVHMTILEASKATHGLRLVTHRFERLEAVLVHLIDRWALIHP